MGYSSVKMVANYRFDGSFYIKNKHSMLLRMIGGTLNTTEIAHFIDSLCSSIVSSISWSATKDFANSAFTISLMGALAGAFAGAAAAQRIAERSKRRAELLSEIRNTNAAIAVAFGAFNMFFALKKQHIQSLEDHYSAKKIEVEEFQRRHLAGENQPGAAFSFEADLRTIMAPSFPMDILRALVFERLSIVSRPLNLVLTLSQTAKGLEEALTARNTWIEDYKLDSSPNKPSFELLYFGLPFPKGNGQVMHLEYPSLLNAIVSQTDDGIFFCNLLCKDLNKHGKQLLGDLKQEFKGKMPRVADVDFSSVEGTGLMPEEKSYADWTSAFAQNS